MSTSSQVAMAYDKWSDEYDSCANSTRDLDAVVVLKMDLNLARKRVLETGCGTGRHTEHFLKTFGDELNSYIAFDLSEGMLSKARKRIETLPASVQRKVQLLNLDLLSIWPASDNSVDVVFENLVLEHIQSLEHFFTEAARVLKTGGKLLISEYHPYRLYLGGKAHYKSISNPDEIISDPPSFPHHLSEFIQLGMKSGFSLAHIDELWDDDENSSMKSKSAPRILFLSFTRN